MTTRSRCTLLLLVGWLVTGGVVTAQDWPQLLGPTRNGAYSGVSLSETWPEGGPTRLWERPVGAGFAGPAVVGDRVILFHRVGGDEVVEALAAESGETVWRYAYPTTYRDDFGFDEGPRSVPVVADGRVHTYGAQGQLHTVDLATGAALWHVDTHARYAVRKGFFGAAGSPLVEAGRLIANVGGGEGGIVAFDAATGDELWTATADESSYSSPVGATFGGRRHALFFTRTGLVGLDPTSGEVLFQKRWRSRSGSSVNAATPLVDGNRIFLSSSYQTGATLLRVDGKTLVEEWAGDESMTNHYATAVIREGVLYGYHGRQEYGPSLRAVDLETGQVRWSEEGFGAGSVILAGTKLLILRESGELLLAEASPDGFVPIVKAQLLPGVVRAYPALADGRVYARNTDTLVAVDLR
ncbi:MAG: PQQ-like beta-propeller repeat protein [Acidobacteria bacterium]|nr:PQQ-like beta-propeller repeat protein [Acidobacteriota bacterium]